MSAEVPGPGPGCPVPRDAHRPAEPYLHQWRPASKLKKGEHLQTPDGSLAVADGGTTPKIPDGWMWDLTVPGNNDHDFYVEVLGSAVLVHNAGICFDPDTLTINDSHIVNNHTPEGMFSSDPSKTSWLSGTTAESRAAIINQVLSRGQVVTDTQNRDGVVLQYTFKTPVGTKALPGGRLQTLYTMRVYYDPGKNYVRNAFPVP